MAGLAFALAACSGSTAVSPPSPSARPALHPPQLAVVDVGRKASSVALGAGSAWVANSGDGTVSEIDAAGNRLKQTFRVGDTAVLRSQGCSPGTVHSAPDGSFAVRRCDLPSAVIFTAGSLWVTKDDEQSLLRLDPATHRVLNRIKLGIGPFLMAAGAGSIWVTDYERGALARVDISTNSLVTVIRGLTGGPSGVAVGAGAVWVANRSAATVVRIDPASNAIVATIPVGVVAPETGVGPSPLAITADDGGVWVKNEYNSDVVRIDPGTNRVVATVPVGPKEGRDGVDSIALDGGLLWVSGMRLHAIDTRTNAVVRELPQDAATVTAAGDGTLWITDVAGRVVRVRAT